MAQAELSCHEPAAWWGSGLAGFGPGWSPGSAHTLCGAQDPQPSNQNPTDTTVVYKSLEGCSGTLRRCSCSFTALEDSLAWRALWGAAAPAVAQLSARTRAMQPPAHRWEPGERRPCAAGGHRVAEHNTRHCSAPLMPAGPRATVPNPTGERRWGWCVQRLCVAPGSSVAKVLRLSFRRTANSTKPDSWILWACLDAEPNDRKWKSRVQTLLRCFPATGREVPSRSTWTP